MAGRHYGQSYTLLLVFLVIGSLARTADVMSDWQATSLGGGANSDYGGHNVTAENVLLAFNNMKPLSFAIRTKMYNWNNLARSGHPLESFLLNVNMLLNEKEQNRNRVHQYKPRTSLENKNRDSFRDTVVSDYSRLLAWELYRKLKSQIALKELTQPRIGFFVSPEEMGAVNEGATSGQIRSLIDNVLGGKTQDRVQTPEMKDVDRGGFLPLGQVWGDLKASQGLGNTEWIRHVMGDLSDVAKRVSDWKSLITRVPQQEQQNQQYQKQNKYIQQHRKLWKEEDGFWVDPASFSVSLGDMLPPDKASFSPTPWKTSQDQDQDWLLAAQTAHQNLAHVSDDDLLVLNRDQQSSEPDKRADRYKEQIYKFLRQTSGDAQRIPLQDRPRRVRIYEKNEGERPLQLTQVPADRCQPENDGTQAMRCPSNTDQCLYDVMICDGKVNCPQGEDESFPLCVFRHWTSMFMRKFPGMS